MRGTANSASGGGVQQTLLVGKGTTNSASVGGVGESGALRSGVWFRANNLMIMMTQHNFCLLFD